MNLKLNTSIDSVYDSLTEFTNQLNKDLNIIDKNESKAVFELDTTLDTSSIHPLPTEIASLHLQ